MPRPDPAETKRRTEALFARTLVARAEVARAADELAKLAQELRLLLGEGGRDGA